MSLRSTLLSGFPFVHIIFWLPPYLPVAQQIPSTFVLQVAQADQASGDNKGPSQQKSEGKEVTYPTAFKSVGYAPKPLPASKTSYLIGLKEYQSSGELVLEKDALTFKSDKDTVRVVYQQIEQVTHEMLPSRFLNQPPVHWVMVRFRSTEGAPQLAMFGGEKGRGKNIDRILDSIQAALNANKEEMAFKRNVSEAALPPLERLAHWVELFEAAESGRPTGMTEEELKNKLPQASTEMKLFLDTHPDDVDAIVLSVRLARFQETSGVEVVSGKNAEEELAQAGKEARARVDALAGRLDHALALKPDRDDAYYWKARIYGVSQPAIRDGRFVRVPIDLQEAIRNCRRATELAPGNAHYREALAQYLILDEKYDDAADVIHPVAGGQHIISVLLAGRKALPVPDKAVRDPIGAAGFAEMQMGGSRQFDYPGLRVQEYIINAPASEVTAFYQKRWPEFQFFESSHEKNEEAEMHLWGQLLRGPNNALQPLTNKHDFDRAAKSNEASTDGISLALMEIRQRSENKRKDFNGVAVGDVFCVLTVLDGRTAPAR
jgi:hypothetical protein